jgi:hypothetical protein
MTTFKDYESKASVVDATNLSSVEDIMELVDSRTQGMYREWEEACASILKDAKDCTSDYTSFCIRDPREENPVEYQFFLSSDKPIFPANPEVADARNDFWTFGFVAYLVVNVRFTSIPGDSRNAAISITSRGTLPTAIAGSTSEKPKWIIGEASFWLSHPGD